MTGTMNPPGQQVQEDWKDGERKLREREVQHGRVAVWSGSLSTIAQVVIAVAAVIAALLAANAVKQASRAVDVSAESMERQSAADRLSTAIEATGGDQEAQRAAGFTLLRQLASRQIAGAETDREEEDAHSLYGASLDVLEVYLRHGPAVPVNSETAGRGYGRPTVPIDNIYAAAAMKALMGLEEEVLSLDPDSRPRVDLAAVQLYGVSWPGIDFGWLDSFYFAGIDLRRANLTGSVWGEVRDGAPTGAALTRAFLQCANLTDADLIGVNLTGADLRGAVLYGADLTGANLDGADLTGAVSDEETIGPDGEEFLVSPPPSSPTPGPNDGCIDAYQAFPEP